MKPVRFEKPGTRTSDTCDTKRMKKAFIHVHSFFKHRLSGRQLPEFPGNVKIR